MIVELNVIPDTSGIYFFYGKDGKILYIGKARNLRNRISSHVKSHVNFQNLLSEMNGLAGMKDEDVWTLKWKIQSVFVSQPIDVVFGNISEIRYKLVEKRNLKQTEEEYVKNMSPPFNFSSDTKIYFEEQTKLLEAIKKLDDENFRRAYQKREEVLL